MSESSDEAVALWNQVDQLMSEDALSILIAYGSSLAGYDTEVVGELTLWPQGSQLVPDLRASYVN